MRLISIYKRSSAPCTCWS